VSFDQNVADYGVAVAIVIVMIPFLLSLIWLGRRDVRQAVADNRLATQEFTAYLRQDAQKQTEILVASVNAMHQMAESLRDADRRADQRHLEVMLHLQRMTDMLKVRTGDA